MLHNSHLIRLLINKYISKSYIILTVYLDPPGPPAISGIGEGDTLQAGERRNVTCTCPGGNPRPSLIWYRAGRLLDDSYKSVVQERSIRTINILELLATEADDGVVLECQAASDLLRLPLTANVSLSVYCEWIPFACCEMHNNYFVIFV